jgi:hypothetical protein
MYKHPCPGWGRNHPGRTQTHNLGISRQELSLRPALECFFTSLYALCVLCFFTITLISEMQLSIRFHQASFHSQCTWFLTILWRPASSSFLASLYFLLSSISYLTFIIIHGVFMSALLLTSSFSGTSAIVLFSSSHLPSVPISHPSPRFRSEAMANFLLDSFSTCTSESNTALMPSLFFIAKLSLHDY